ncbi:MAG TPA: enoyl-CoA hydratase-related protein [Acidimicrobiales bacterium]|nr:enoyl-CoA hydratase-related protein [Acidimicrobiales bacterium]
MPGRVRVETAAPGVTTVTLDRPDRLNALDVDLVEELHRVLDEVAADRDCRVVVLTGAGRGFCSGLDLRDERHPMGDEGPAAQLRSQRRTAGLVPRLRALPQPVVAAVNGPASGGGLALALGCDVRLAAASARFDVAFVRVGLSGGDMGVSWLLPRLIGASRAWELMLTGRAVDAAEAAAIGLVLRVVPDDDLRGEALALAGQIAANSPLGVALTKEVLWAALEVGSLQAGIDLENRTQALATFGDDVAEAAAAFRERRAPRFTGR